MVVEKCLIEIGEVQTMLCKVGEALWFIPNDLHKLYCSYNIMQRQGAHRIHQASLATSLPA
jgi:hypothetical protein